MKKMIGSKPHLGIWFKNLNINNNTSGTMKKMTILKGYIALTFFILPLFLSAQQFKASEKIPADRVKKLSDLWVENSFKWEQNQVDRKSFFARQAGDTLYRDSLITVQLMGFSKRGEPIYYQTYNLFGARTLKTNNLWSGGVSELDLNGEDMTLGIWDGGKLRHTHQEFGGRTTQMDDDGFMSGHSNHVAGTMVSAGLVPTAKGMAPQANLHAYTFTEDETEMIEAVTNGLLISNHSYGRPTGWLFMTNQWWWYGDTRISDTEDYKFGFYTEETRVRDEITYLAPYYLQVHASGNDALDTGPEEGEEHNVYNHDVGAWVKSTDSRIPDGGEQGYDMISSLVLGKNVLTIGSVADASDYSGPESVQISEFTSTGPTDDGRIKPDLSAKGQGLLSTWVDDDQSYAGLTGTSMAAPTITGSLILLQQLNHRLYGDYLRASTVKALAIHTAREAGPHPGPDYKYGWGLPDIEAAAGILPEKDNNTIIQERNLVQDAVPSYTRTVYSNGSKPLEATLVWTDVPGEVKEPALNDRTPTLVNDLDLRITRLDDQQVFYPWRLDPDNPADAAIQGDNQADNVEKIQIMLPDPGEYLVEVTHKGQLVDLINEQNKRQSFSLVISGIAERTVDLAITDFNVLVSGCSFSAQTPAFVTIENKGQQAVQDLEIAYMVTNKNQDTLSEGTLELENLDPGMQEDLEVFADLSEGFEFTFSASVEHPNDMLPANNHFERQIVSDSWMVSEDSYENSFEGIADVAEIGWQIINANDDGSSWMLRIADGENQFASDGANTMRYGVLNPAEDGVETQQQGNDWLISNCMFLTPGENYRLSFDYRAWTSDFPESMKVWIGQSDNPEAFTELLVDLENFDNEEFLTELPQFSVEEEGNYFIAFQVTSQPDHRFIYLDNIIVERMVFNDIAADDLTINASGCDFSAETSITASFANMGLDPQENFDLQLEVYHFQTDQSFNYTETFNGTLQSLEEGEVEFTANMSLYGEYELTLTTLLPNDEKPGNNQTVLPASNSLVDLEVQSFFTNFDGLESEEDIDWTIINVNNDSHTWRHYGVAGQSYSRPNSMNYYRGASGDGNPGVTNDWLITNCLRMEEGNTYRISFYTATQGTNDQDEYDIYLMEGTQVEDTLQQFGYVHIDKFEYTHREYVVVAPHTGIFHIGFHVSTNPPSSVQSFIDDVTIEKAENTDLTILSIDQKTFGCNAFDAQTPVEVVLKNRGINDIDEATIQLTATTEEGENELYEIVYQELLPSQAIDTVSFEVDLSQLNTIYELNAQVLHPEDEEPVNDTLTDFIRNTSVDLTQGDLYFNDFEMTEIDGHSRLMDPLLGWWYENANSDIASDGLPITWVLRKNNDFALSGEVSVRSGRSTEEAADDWLFSNCFQMDKDEKYLLNFHYTGRTASATEKMSVYLGTSQDSGTMTQLLWDETFSSGIDYQKATITFSPPENGTYYIGFHHYSDADQAWIFLDDFSITRNYDLDLAMDSIQVQSDACGISESTPVRFSYKNSGNDVFDHPVTLTYQVIDPDGNISETGEQVQQITMNTGDVVSFDVNVDLRKYGEYILEALVELPEEAEEPMNENNSLEITFRNTTMFPQTEDIYITFEDYENLDETGFSFSDENSDGFRWDLGTNFTNFSFSGEKVLYYTYNEDNSADDWLFSSCARLEAETVYNVSYYYRIFSADYPESMDFGIASEPHPDHIIEVLDVKEEMINQNFRRVTYAFSVPETGNYFFAWHAYSPAFHRFILVDDLALKTAPVADAVVNTIEAQVSPCEFNQQTPIRASLRNLGSEALPAGEMQVAIAGNAGEQTLTLETPALEPLQKTDISFDADMTGQGRVLFDYELEIPGDDVASNNQGSFAIFASRVDLQQPGSWFIQDFETVFSLRETDWSIFNVNNDNRYWGIRVNDPGLSFSGHNYLVYFTGNTSKPANDWVISGCYDLNEDLRYKAAFYYRLGSGDHNLKMAVGDSPFPEAMNQTILEEISLTEPNQPYKALESSFEIGQSGKYHFGIQQFSKAGQGSSLVDDVVVIAQPLIMPVDMEQVNTDPGNQITVEALGSDSLRWYADEELTQIIGEGSSYTHTFTEELITVYAAERVYGITGPADLIELGPGMHTAEDLWANGDLNIYPNPATEKIYMDIPFADQEKITVKIFDMLGELVTVVEMKDTENPGIDISSLPEGMYIVNLQTRDQKLQGSFVKF